MKLFFRVYNYPCLMIDSNPIMALMYFAKLTYRGGYTIIGFVYIPYNHIYLIPHIKIYCTYDPLIVCSKIGVYNINSSHSADSNTLDPILYR